MRRQPGFTLIELMITVAIIAILAAIAYPSYSSYTKRSNRSAAEQLMLEIANREERFMADNRSYTQALDNTGLNMTNTLNTQGWTCATASSITTCSNNFYSISVSALTTTPPGYTISATATAVQSSDGNLTLTSAGVKTRSAGDFNW